MVNEQRERYRGEIGEFKTMQADVTRAKKDAQDAVIVSEYANDPSVEGSETNPYVGAFESAYAENGNNVRYVLGPGRYREPGAPITVDGPITIEGAGRGGRPFDKAAATVVETETGDGFLVIDNTSNTAEHGHIEGLWIYQSADDATGTGIELREAVRWTLDNLGVVEYDTGVSLNGATSNTLGGGVRTINNNVNVELSRSSAYTGIAPNVNLIGGHHKAATGVASIRQMAGLVNKYQNVTVQACEQNGMLIDGGQVTDVSGYFEVNNTTNAGSVSDIRVKSHGYGLSLRDIRTTSGDVSQSIYLDSTDNVVLQNVLQADTGVTGIETTANTGYVYERSCRVQGGHNVADWRSYQSKDPFGGTEGTVDFLGPFRHDVPMFTTIAVDVRNISSPENADYAHHDGSGSNTAGLAYYDSGASAWVSVIDGSAIN